MNRKSNKTMHAKTMTGARARGWAWPGTAVIAALLATACGASGSYTWVDNAPDAFFRPSVGLLINPGDVISVRVFGQDNLSVRTAVRADGSIAMPLIGDVPVTGKNLSVVAKEIQARLQPFVTTPNVIVVVEEAHIRLVAIGEVRRTGPVVLDANDAGLLPALANAGGLTEFASKSGIFVLRTDSTGVYRIRFEYNDIIQGVGKAAAFKLRSGDQLVVE